MQRRLFLKAMVSAPFLAGLPTEDPEILYAVFDNYPETLVTIVGYSSGLVSVRDSRGSWRLVEESDGWMTFEGPCRSGIHLRRYPNWAVDWFAW
jgi:hypothetical protein